MLITKILLIIVFIGLVPTFVSAKEIGTVNVYMTTNKIVTGEETIMEITSDTQVKVTVVIPDGVTVVGSTGFNSGGSLYITTLHPGSTAILDLSSMIPGKYNIDIKISTNSETMTITKTLHVFKSKKELEEYEKTENEINTDTVKKYDLGSVTIYTNNNVDVDKVCKLIKEKPYMKYRPDYFVPYKCASFEDKINFKINVVPLPWYWKGIRYLVEGLLYGFMGVMVIFFFYVIISVLGEIVKE